MSENKLRWFGYEMGREERKTVREVMRMNVDGRKGKGSRPKRDGWIRLRDI